SYMVQQLLSAFTSAKTTAWLWLILVAGAGTLAFVSLLGNHDDSGPLRRVILLSGTVVAGSCLPNIWGHASWASMPDTILLSICFMSLALGFGAYTLFRYGRLTARSFSTGP